MLSTGAILLLVGILICGGSGIFTLVNFMSGFSSPLSMLGSSLKDEGPPPFFKKHIAGMIGALVGGMVAILGLALMLIQQFGG